MRGLLVVSVLAMTLACGGGGGGGGTPVPPRTVTGSRIFTFLPLNAATGVQSEDSGPGVPSDPATYISALSADGTTYPGTYTLAAGTFSIPNVPAGHYWLKVERGTHDYYVWTDKSAVDLGTKAGGRGDVAYASTSPTNVSFDMTNMDPWSASGDYLQFFDYNTDTYGEPDYEAWVGWPGAGETVLNNLTVDWATWRLPLVDTTRGDAPKLLQMVDTNLGPIHAYIAKKEYAPASLTMLNGSSATINGAFSAIPLTSTVTVNFNGAEFASVNTPTNPAATKYNPYLNFWDAPGLTTYGNQGGAVCALRTYNTAANVNAGTVNVSAPPAGFERLVRGYARQDLDIQLPGTTLFWRYTGGIRTFSTTLPTASAPVRPMIGPIQAPRINGVSLFDNQSGVGLTPTISWTAPTIGTAQGYVVYVYNMYVDGTNTAGSQIASIWISGSQTQFKLPPGLLESGKTYFLCVRACMEGGYDPESAPFQDSHLPYGFAESLSGLITP